MILSNVAIIGCNGFIGRALTERLLKNDKIKLKLFGRGKDRRSQSHVPYFEYDYKNKSALQEQFKDIDLVYYLISETIPATSWVNPFIEIEKNLVPFIQYMEAISTLGVKKVVFVSSAGTIYGPSDKKVNEGSDKQPFSPYGITKLSMEHYLNYYEKKFGIQHDIYRVSNVYGEGQNTSKGLGIINTFIENIIRDGKITVFGDGKNIRNYIYINDVAELLTLSLKAAEASEIYNLSSDDTLSINDLVSLLKKTVPEDFEVLYTETRQSDNSVIVLDNSKIKKSLPGHQLTPIAQGLKQTYNSLKEQLSSQNVKNKD